jgi:Domain of unknown function (DUF4440)
MMHHHCEEKSFADNVHLLTILNDRMLQAEEDGDAGTLAAVLTEDFTIIRTSGAKQDREIYLQAVGTNAHRGRTAEEPEIRLYHGCAVVTIRVTTAEKQDEALTVRRFWNTRAFIWQEDQWRCATWQVTEIRE